LSKPPDSYNSVKGVKNTEEQSSFFKVSLNGLAAFFLRQCGNSYPMLLLQADEYVVYSAHQQRMRYLVEFSLPDEESAAVEDAREIDKGGLGGEIEVAEEDMEPEPSEGERNTATRVDV
jgi:hypothetical protein